MKKAENRILILLIVILSVLFALSVLVHPFYVAPTGNVASGGDGGDDGGGGGGGESAPVENTEATPSGTGSGILPSGSGTGSGISATGTGSGYQTAGGGQFIYPASCTDSDGGKNYEKAGVAITRNSSGIFSSVADRCSGDNLYEYYCEGNNSAYEVYVCPNGCNGVDGSCRRPQLQQQKTENILLIEKLEVKAETTEEKEVQETTSEEVPETQELKEKDICGVYSRELPETAFASSAMGEYPALNAIDDNLDTKWYGSFELAYPKWIAFDLGEKKCIRAIDLYVYEWDLPITFDVHVSNDGITWNNLLHDIKMETPREIGLAFPKPVIAKFIRIYEKSGGRKFGSLEEIKILMADYLIK